MAWLDDRIWAHPKMIGLSDRAFRVAVNAICYSSGFHTEGNLTAQQQRTIGTKPAIKKELISAGLWHENGAEIDINDWEEHNGKRDEKKRKTREDARERKRRERARKAESQLTLPEEVTRDTGRDVTRDIGVTDSVTSLACASAGAPLMTGDRVTENQEQEQQQTLKDNLALAAARANGGQPAGSAAAAAQVEAPTQTQIDEALGTLKATDKGSFARVAPLAEQLPTDVFDQVVQRVHDRKNSGQVKNDVGLLVDLLRTTIRAIKVTAAEEHAARIANRTPREEFAGLGRGYALSEIPWDAALDLLDLKLRRATTEPEDHADLLQAAHDAYDQAADPEPVVSVTPPKKGSP